MTPTRVAASPPRPDAALDEATIKSYRRHLEKNRPPRTEEEDERYRVRKRELKLAHAVCRIFSTHFDRMPRVNGTSMSHGPGVMPSTPVSIDAPGFEIVRAYYRRPPLIEVQVKWGLEEPYRSIVDGLIQDLREDIQIPIEVQEVDHLHVYRRRNALTE